MPRRSRSSSTSSYEGRRRSKRRHSDDSGSPPSKRMSQKVIRAEREQLFSTTLGYSDQSNPFGDLNLSAPFVWKKKEQILKAAGKLIPNKTEDFLRQAERKITEVEKLKKRREEREEEERLLEEQRVILARERELEYYEDWVIREEHFHHHITNKRSETRLKEGRAHPCDYLLKELRIANGKVYKDLFILSDDPLTYMLGLSIDNLKNLLKDAEEHQEICKAVKDRENQEIAWGRELEEDHHRDTPDILLGHFKFWSSLLLVGTDLLEKKLKGDDSSFSSENKGRDISTGVPLSVLKDLKSILENKTEEELNLIEQQVIKKLKIIKGDPSSSSDLTYWETILDKLPYYKAVAELRRVHEVATEKITQLKKNAQITTSLLSTPTVSGSCDIQTPMSSTTPPPPPQPKNDDQVVICDRHQIMSPYWPPLREISEFVDVADCLVDCNEFLRSRRQLRQHIIRSRKEKHKLDLKDRTLKKLEQEKSVVDSGLVLYEKFVREEENGMTADEYIMTTDIMPTSDDKDDVVPLGWDAQFRPRKPRFFNRVKTGYEWTKYNQSHFDQDNPPPKAVQGYKFNLFYPDLLDRTKSPSWKLLPSESSDTLLIRFFAGPPYEDVMFKIVNREWDTNSRKGFRNTFDRGILQLHFNFKRFRYRK